MVFGWQVLCLKMPSLLQLCKRSYSLTESQNRLKLIFVRSLFISEPSFGDVSGELVFHFEDTGSSRRFSEVADPGRSLSTLGPPTFSTSSVSSRIWNRCCSNPCQAELEKKQPYRSKKVLFSKLIPLFYGTLNAPSPMFSPRCHVSLLDLPQGSTAITVASINSGGHQNRTGSSENCLLSSISIGNGFQPFLCLPSWRSRIDESRNGNESFYDIQRSKQLLVNWPLSTAIAFHLMRCGLFLFPAVSKSSGISEDSLIRVASSIAVQPGVVLDSATDKCSSELAENSSEGSLSSSGLRLLSGACCLPHPEKQDTGGEDAYFICPDKQVIGVADGVGGWADMGIDAGEYARQLMNHSLIAAQQEPAGCIDTARVMEIAHSKTMCRGSSTACILALSKDCLEAANLGDSGFLVVRNGRLVFKSPPQQHNFNVPFQLENGGGDPPDAAQLFTVEVVAGDVVVAGTDGLFDNLYETDIVGLVVQASRVGSSPDISAKKIAALARERAQDCNRQTPFSAAAQDAGFRFFGGKMDDITVVVSYVVK